MKLFSAATLLPIIGPPIPEGALVIKDGKIVEVGDRKSLSKKYPEARQEEFSNGCLMPGLVNADTQLELLSFDGANKGHYIDWLISRIDFAQSISPSEARANITEGIEKLLQSGITCAGDVGRYAGTLDDFLKAPLRFTLFPELLAFSGTTGPENYESVFNTLDQILSKKSDLLSAGLAPFSSYTLSRNLLKIVGQQANAHKVPLKIRAAESFAEMQLFFESSGEIREKLFPKLGWGDSLPPIHRKTPVEYLNSLGILSATSALIGCLHLAEADYKILKQRGCSVIWKPRAQKYLNLGEAPIQKLRKNGTAIGLGSDGTGSRHSLSLWDEMREGLKLASPEELLEMATVGGATCLGRSEEVGTLEKGRLADFIVVRSPRGAKPSHLAKKLIEETTENELLAVYIHGEKAFSSQGR